jgi:hypothetical protein
MLSPLALMMPLADSLLMRQPLAQLIMPRPSRLPIMLHPLRLLAAV